MFNINRRRFLRGVAASALASSVLGTVPARAASLRPCGCCLRPLAIHQLATETADMTASSTTSIQLTFSSGDSTTDRFLGEALLGLSAMFDVQPGFAFFDDSRSPNAFAAPDSVVPGTVGTVVMGRQLFREQIANEDNGMTIIAICAHEFGHIHQFGGQYRKDLVRLDPTARPVELHADFLAGVFLASRKKEHPDLDLFKVGETFNQLGDTDYRNPQHHGTPEERTAAITAGFDLGQRGARTFNELALAGVDYVKGAMR